MSRLGVLVLCAALVAGLGGCGQNAAETNYEQEVTQDRVQRDMEMREDESVLASDRRDSFRGLDYFEVDPAYRFVVPFQEEETPDTIMLAENTGRTREQVQVGSVAVPLPSGDATLAVFQGESDDPRGRLWIPFADATNGDDTYEAGRYVDLRTTDGDSIIVDFNRAYNPTCVYNPDYACPFPPPENRLEAPIPAGEKMPKF